MHILLVSVEIVFFLEKELGIVKINYANVGVIIKKKTFINFAITIIKHVLFLYLCITLATLFKYILNTFTKYSSKS